MARPAAPTVTPRITPMALPVARMATLRTTLMAHRVRGQATVPTTVMVLAAQPTATRPITRMGLAVALMGILRAANLQRFAVKEWFWKNCLLNSLMPPLTST